MHAPPLSRQQGQHSILPCCRRFIVQSYYGTPRQAESGSTVSAMGMHSSSSLTTGVLSDRSLKGQDYL